MKSRFIPLTPLGIYLRETNETMLAFSRKCQLSVGTIFSIRNGSKPTRRTAKKICRQSNGKLKMQDFGHD